ncbi:hypothetical protein [Mesorhizobium sp. f-mel]
MRDAAKSFGKLHRPPVWLRGLGEYSPPMVDKMLHRLIIGVAVAAMTSGATFAEGNSTSSQNGTLPGVADDYRIAKPDGASAFIAATISST